MKILHILEPVISGTKTHLMQILDHLPRPEFQQSLLCSVERDESFMEEVHRLRERGVRVSIVPMEREPNLFSDIHAFFRIYRHLSHRRYDIVHVHCAKAGVLGRLAAFLTRGRAGSRSRPASVVYTPHVFPFTQDVPYWHKLIYRFVEKIMGVGAFTDRIVVLTDYQRSLAEEHGIGTRESVTLIPNGVAEPPRRGVSAEDRRRIREEMGVKSNDLLVGTVGRISRQKGHRFLVEAAAILLDRHPHLQFYIAGGGELEARLRALTQQLSWCRQRISFLGERQDVAGLLAATDIFVLPSLWEGLPYALLEAMAAGKPVICSNVCGLGEIVQNGVNGLLVPPGSSRALALAISRLTGDRALCTRLGAAARKTVRDHFRSEDTLEQLAQMYRDLMA